MENSLNLMLFYLKSKGVITEKESIWLKNNRKKIIELFYLTQDYNNVNHLFNKREKKQKLIDTKRLCKMYLDMKLYN